MNPIYFPTEPGSPSITRIGAPAGVWTEDLDTVKTSSKPPKQPRVQRTSNMAKKRASQQDAELSEQRQARKKGQTAYYTVTVDKRLALRFNWKCAKGKIGAFNKVKFVPGWDIVRAEFEAKFRYDLYWGNATKSFNRDLIISTGRHMLREFAKAKAKGSAFPLSSEHSLKGLMQTTLTRDVDDATIAKIMAHREMIAQQMADP